MNLQALLLVTFCLLGLSSKGQPYHSTYITNRLVKENTYLGTPPKIEDIPKFTDIQNELPNPIWKSRPDVIKCYWKTWELAFSNFKKADSANGFVANYIDPAFNGNIFMWDCSFMTMFGKYANRIFNFQGSLNNFYAKQHDDGFICRQIRRSDGTDCFERFDPSSTGPNIMPWAEWEYFLTYDDSLRLKRVFPVLLAYYQWFNLNRTWPDGTYYSSGWGCGMDNQPRFPEVENVDHRFSTAHMSWIDITLQQIFAGKLLISMAVVLDREKDVLDIEKEITALTDFVQTKMWDEQEAFFFDRYADATLSHVKSIGAFWSLLSGVIMPGELDRFTRHLENSSEFARLHRVNTLAADNMNYDSSGGYWKGAIWAPTNYMILRGLTNFEKDSLAYEIALNHLDNVVKVFNQTGTLWENYSPEIARGNNHKDFVGWTGLVPINILFEYIFGFRPNIQEKSLTIDVRLLDEYGIERYPFGKSGLLNLFCKRRKNQQEKPSLSISSNVSLKLILKWSGGESQKDIQAGKTYQL